MKHFLTFFLVITIVFGAFAQNLRSVDEISKVLQNEVLFIKYRNFKSDFEKMTLDKSKEINSYRDYEKLKTAYKEVEAKYNGFLIQIKNDLSRWEEIQRMTKTPADYALRYQAQFGEVVNVYTNKYLPVYNSINKGKSIKVSPSLIQLGIELFTSVVDLIRGRKEERVTSMNAILGSINTYFYKQIRMKEWGEMPIAEPKPDGTSVTFNNRNNTANTGINPGKLRKPGQTTPSTPQQNQPAPAQDNPSAPSVPSSPTTLPTSLPDVTVPAPTFEEIRGWVEFNTLKNGQPEAMAFVQKKSKDITVAELQTNGTDVVVNTTSSNVAYFKSAENYGNGTQFNIKVFNKSGMYVLALNSNNKIDFLYPFKNERLGSCDKDKANGKDITVLEATPIVGQNEDGITILPIPNCDKNPPAPRYFTIQGNQTTPENFCILLSRSELNIEQIKKRLEAESGDLHDRLARTFGTYIIPSGEGDLSVENNRMSFDASAAKNNVLPVVFYIGRN